MEEDDVPMGEGGTAYESLEEAVGRVHDEAAFSGAAS